MQILGQGAALYILDMLVKPAFGGGLVVDMFLFLVKGFATFYLYKWFACSTSGIIRNPLAGTSFWMALLGGIIGMFTLMVVGMLVNERAFRGAGGELVVYGIEAVVLNVVYGLSADLVQDMARSSFGRYG